MAKLRKLRVRGEPRVCISVSLPFSTWRAVETAAVSQAIPMSQLVREAIEKALISLPFPADGKTKRRA